MKKEFNVLRILYICWSIAIVANVISFSISKETVYFGNSLPGFSAIVGHYQKGR